MIKKNKFNHALTCYVIYDSLKSSYVSIETLIVLKEISKINI